MTTGSVPARRWAARCAALLPALLLAGCLGAESPSEHAADYTRAFASAQGLTLQNVRCALHGEVAWTCIGRALSGQVYTCSVGPTGRVSPTVVCSARARTP